MHPEAERWAAGQLEALAPGRVVEFGSRIVNGSARRPGIKWWGIDLEPGPGVDTVGDAATFDGQGWYDAVVCTEVLEHTVTWSDLLASAVRALRPGGALVLTCAGPGRPPHSAVDGGELRPGEFYGNVEPAALRAVLRGWFTDAVVIENTDAHDLYALAVR
jgi:SAM-dependent methyltransferase